jgi:hypothetical protein
MPFHKFGSEELCQIAISTRNSALAELARLAQQNADSYALTIQPGEATTQFLLDSEEMRWSNMVKNLARNLVFWSSLTVAIGLLGCAALLLLSDMDIAFVVASVLTGLLLSGAFFTGASSLKNLIQIYKRGYCETAVDTLLAHGRNIFIIGGKGIYISLNNANQRPERTCAFYAFGSLQAPTLAEATNQTLIQLATASGTPIRTCIFSQADHAIAIEAVQLLKEAINTFRTK